jgi:sulfite oxidase
MVERPLELSMGELLARFRHHELTAALVCAGNRRRELAAVRPVPAEVLWGADAISAARWRGVRLADVLRAAGVEPGARHVAFCGLDRACVDGGVVPFGASIPLEKALSSEVLLAHAMNEAPLAREHGFPLRVVVAGYVGARSVKWLREITLQREPSTNYFEAHDYKTFPPEVTAETADWSRGTTLNEVALNAVICTPREGEVRDAGPNLVQGYAVPGEGVPVERVELSVDQGASWTPAAVPESTGRWSWCFWEVTLDLPRGDHEIAVRAWDAAGRTQPADVGALWNFKGYANNAWHRVHVRVR